MNFWEFAREHYVIALILAIAWADVFGAMYNRTMRYLNIRKAGWPPAHLDADGDWKPKDSK